MRSLDGFPTHTQINIWSEMDFSAITSYVDNEDRTPWAGSSVGRANGLEFLGRGFESRLARSLL